MFVDDKKEQENFELNCKLEKCFRIKMANASLSFR